VVRGRRTGGEGVAGHLYPAKSTCNPKLETEWTAYPILHLSFARTRYNEAKNLDTLLNIQLTRWERIYGNDPIEETFGARFDGIIHRAYEQTGKRVVILIDEYDSPMLDSNANEALRQELRDTVREFFSPLKDDTNFIRFLFITGITKFSQMSIFSELNSLDDISLWDEYSAICGITENELLTQFKPDIEALARKNDETYEEACTHLKHLYDGYHFSQRSEDIYNPFSLINVLSKRMYGSYWYATGTPSFLVESLQARDIEIPYLEDCETIAASFDKSTDTLTDPLPVLYQSGYLTIKSYKDGVYTLGFPNEEVRYGFIHSLLPSTTGQSVAESSISMEE
jgi:hypothetical protein